ncbi:MAG: TonB-dependent receptor [Woeseia sp.]
MNRNITRIMQRLLLIPALAGVAGTANAQQAGDLHEEIVVVGTRGEARSALDSPVPVDVITADDIANVQSLGGELGELLQALAPSFSFPRQSNSGAADHVRSAQLRGMNPDHVLVLVNGKRQHTASVIALESKIGLGSNPFDFNTIPLNAVERIEILRDGAGAQYGSDAIAGVINIVLKSAGSGGQVSAMYGGHRTDFEPTGQTITDGHTWSIAGDYGIEVGDGALHFGAEYRERAPTNRAGIGVLPFFEEQTPANQALDPARVFSPGDGGADDISLWYNLSLPLAGATADREFYSFGRFANRESEGTGFFRYPDGFTSNPAVHPDGFRPITLGDNQDLSFTAGLKGHNFETNWDLSLTIGQNDFESGLRNSANPSLGAASPTSFHLRSFTFTQTILNADFVRNFDTGAFAGPLSFAYGVELRLEDYETGAGDPASYEAGPVVADIGAQAGPGLPPDSVADVDRTVSSLYVDIEAEVADGVNLGLAARYEDYDDFGDALTGKVTAIWHASEAIALRGAFGTSFRAPSLAQTGFESSTINFGAGGMLEQFRHLPVTDPEAIANGATPLKEEESVNASVGLVITPSELFTVTLDYFQIDVDDRVTFVSAPNNITYFSNRVDTETKGFDLVASGDFDLAGGTFNWQAAYNQSETDVKNPSVLGVEDLNTLESAPPEDKIILSGQWGIDRWSFVVRTTRYGDATRVFDFGGGFPDPQTYRAKWSLDAEVEASVTETWSIAVGADNLLDEYPDRSSPDIGYFGHLPYDVLSGIGMNGAFFYIRSTYGF